ncbi:hypothetical protein [Streptosporangium becharense]|uniref:hypothetical protein n=1 Tax=Streptosporangium becharense TaxID=1816182 RepID=UPI0016137ADD|nr:hypothetical protein [Streptosporangium becharense]
METRSAKPSPLMSSGLPLSFPAAGADGVCREEAGDGSGDGVRSGDEDGDGDAFRTGPASHPPSNSDTTTTVTAALFPILITPSTRLQNT